MRKSFVTFVFLFIITLGFISCVTRKEPTSPTPQNQPIADNKPVDISLRFAVMADSRGSDMGVNSTIVAKTLEEIKKISPQPSFAIMPGDLVGGSNNYEQIKAQLTYFKGIITRYYPIEFFYPGFGNHEATTGIRGEEAFSEVFPEVKANFLSGYNRTVYYFDNNDARFYMLNSNHPGEDHQISDTQLNWIKTTMSDKTRYNFYFFHEPAYPTGSHVGSSLDANGFQRNKLWSIIDDSEKPMVFVGHEHNYTRRHIDSMFNETINNQTFNFKKSVFQVTTGTFGAPIYRGYTDKRNVDIPPIPQYHYTIVDVAKDKTKVSVYNLDGKKIDYFEQ